jgi:hypothetical protein
MEVGTRSPYFIHEVIGVLSAMRVIPNNKSPNTKTKAVINQSMPEGYFFCHAKDTPDSPCLFFPQKRLVSVRIGSHQFGSVRLAQFRGEIAYKDMGGSQTL